MTYGVTLLEKKNQTGIRSNYWFDREDRGTQGMIFWGCGQQIQNVNDSTGQMIQLPQQVNYDWGLKR